jgi:hypothetical protein
MLKKSSNNCLDIKKFIEKNNIVPDIECLFFAIDYDNLKSIAKMILSFVKDTDKLTKNQIKPKTDLIIKFINNSSLFSSFFEKTK